MTDHLRLYLILMRYVNEYPRSKHRGMTLAAFVKRLQTHINER